jgi:NADPH-dependent 2,4-dienoyl-CoA reductase/sulfur reductase-like enzyme
MPTRHLIIGSGIAGLSAAEAIRLRQPDALITMISEEKHDPYSRPGLAYLLRGDIPEGRLLIRRPEELKALAVRRVHGVAERLDCARQEVHLADGGRVRYDTVLLATGALAVPPPFGGEGLEGAVKIDSFDDTLEIIRQARRGRTAVVVGGGVTALELAEGLAARRMRVHYFLRGQRYWADVLDEDESRIVMGRLEHDGITIHTNTQVKRVIEDDGAVAGVETQGGEVVDCDMLAYAIGVRPRVDLARSAGLKVDRGVVVDFRMRASLPGVFAAGDCAQVGSFPLDVLWPTALNQGRVAGVNMAGDEEPYVREAACNVTQLAGLKVTIIGAVGSGGKDPDRVAIVRGDSESWRAASRAWVASDWDEVNRVRLFIGERTITGALVMGDQAWSRPLQRLIAGKADISAIRGKLLVDGATALEQLAAFVERWRP